MTNQISPEDLAKLRSDHGPWEAQAILEGQHRMDRGRPDPGVLDVASAVTVRGDSLFTAPYQWSLQYLGPLAYRRIDPDYSPYQEGEIDGYEEHFAAFSRSRSQYDTSLIKEQIDRERGADRVVAEAGWMGTVGMVGSAVISPENFLPYMSLTKIAKVGRVASLLMTATEGAANTAAAVGLSELVLHQTQLTRTTEESIHNIMAAGVFGGVLGGAARFWSDSVEQVSKRVAVQEISDRKLLQEATEVIGEARMKELAELPGEKQRVVLLDELRSKAPEMAELIEKGQVLNWMLRRGMRSIGPGGRVVTSLSPTLRRWGKAAIEMPFLRKGEAEVPTEAFISRKYEEASDILGSGLNRFYKYQREAKRSALKEKEYFSEVSKAMRREDKAEWLSGKDRIAVEQTATEFRKFFDKWLERLVDRGLITTAELKGTAKSYLTRVWDQNAITAKRAEFKDRIIKPWLGEIGAKGDLEDAAERIVLQIEGSPAGSIPLDVVGEAGPLKERLLLIPDHKVEDFLVNDAREIIHRFVNHVAPQHEMSKAFSPSVSARISQLNKNLDMAIKSAIDGDLAPLQRMAGETNDQAAVHALSRTLDASDAAKARRLEDLTDDRAVVQSDVDSAQKSVDEVKTEAERFSGAQKLIKEVEDQSGISLAKVPKTVRNQFFQELEEVELATERSAFAEASERVKSLDKEITAQRRRFGRSRTDQNRAAAKTEIAALRTRRASANAEVASTGKALREAQKGLRRELSRPEFFEVFKSVAARGVAKKYPRTSKALARWLPKSLETRELMEAWVKAQSSIAQLEKGAAAKASQLESASTKLVASQASLDAIDAQMLVLRKDAHNLDGSVKVRRPSVPLPRTDKQTEDLIDQMTAQVSALRRREARAGVTLENLERQIRIDYGKLMDDAKSPREAEKLRKRRDREIEDFKAVRDGLLNRAGSITTNGDHWVYNLDKGIRQLSFMRFLGGVLISSTPDMGMPVMSSGLRNYIPALRASITGPMKMIKRVLAKPGRESQLIQDELVRQTVRNETLSNMTRLQRLGDVVDISVSQSRTMRGLDWLTEKFTRATLMGRWNGWWKANAIMASYNAVIDAAKKVGTGKSPRTLTRSLDNKVRLAGFTNSDLKKIWQEVSEHGQVEKGQWFPRTDKWGDLHLAEKFKAGIGQDVRRTIITPGVGDLPRLMNIPIARSMLQFKSFAFAATNKILLSGLQRQDAWFFQGMIMINGLGFMTYALKETLAGRDLPDDPATWIRNAIDHAGSFGMPMEINNIAEKVTDGTFGVSGLFGAGPSSRYLSRNKSDAILGPSLGTFEDLLKVGTMPFDGLPTSEQDIHMIRRFSPFQNVFYLRWMFDKVEDDFIDSVSLPRTRRDALMEVLDAKNRQ